jgi:hypothetical protein
LAYFGDGQGRQGGKRRSPSCTKDLDAVTSAKGADRHRGQELEATIAARAGDRKKAVRAVPQGRGPRSRRCLYTEPPSVSRVQVVEGCERALALGDHARRKGISRDA